MMRPFDVFRRGSVIAAALVLAACTAATFSGLQTDYDQLYDRAQDCASGTSPGPDFSGCAGELQTAMLDVAREAEAAVGDAGDARTRIGLLRLAAMAGWQSKLEDGYRLAGAVSVRGQAECDALPEEQFGAPRDCAIHDVMPAFVAHESILQLADLVESGNASEEQRDALMERIATYLNGTWDYIETKRPGIEGDTRLDPRFTAYLESQRPVFLCTALGRLAPLARDLARSQEETDMAAAVRQWAISRSDAFGQSISC